MEAALILGVLLIWLLLRRGEFGRVPEPPSDPPNPAAAGPRYSKSALERARPPGPL